MPDLSSFDYAVVRVVPRVEREEFINAGVVLFCRTRRFLEARTHLDRSRLRALCEVVDVEEAAGHLDLIPRICRGDRTAGPIAELPQAARFHWLVAPRSTVIQTSPVHSGLCLDPQETLDHLFESLVLPPGGAQDDDPTSGE